LRLEVPLINLFFEGIESAILPCSLVLIIPGILISLGSRNDRIIGISAYTVGIILFSWLELSGNSIRFNNTAAGICFAAAALILFQKQNHKNLQLVSVASGLLAGIAAASLWVPCTGEHYGNLTDTMSTAGLSGPFLQASYVLGVIIPLIAFTSIFYIVKPKVIKKIDKPLAFFSTMVLFVFAILVVAGSHETLISNLTKWSLS